MDISTCPLCSLVGLHLLSRDILSMTRGCSIKTRDTGEEYTTSLELPAKLPEELERLKETCPQVLPVICRLVARTVYLTSDFPLAIPDVEEPKKAPPLCMLVKGMDILDELSEVCAGKGEDAEELLEMPVPFDLEYWNDWNQGHVMAALKLYRSLWSQIREPYLTPPKAVAVASVDPAVAGGMAQSVQSTGWQRPSFKPKARARKAKRFTARDKEQGLESDDDGWEIVGETPSGKTQKSEKAGAKSRSAEESRPEEVQPSWKPAGVAGSDFMRDVLQRFIDSRRTPATGQSTRSAIQSPDAQRVALALADGDVEVLAEVFECLIFPVLGQTTSEDRTRLAIQFRKYFEQQQSEIPRRFAGHIEPSQLQKCILRAKNWTLRKVPGDGSCQFHAVGFAVNENHKAVREHAIQWIQEHRDEYKLKIALPPSKASMDDEVSDAALEDELSKKIKEWSEGAWGDDLTLHALANYYKREIWVLKDTTQKAWDQVGNFGNPIYVVFYAEIHYDAVIVPET